MNGTWWVGEQELNDEQQNAIALPIDDDVLLTGPPGSGKTNLLLLRANYLYLSGFHNIAVITFTRALREFIASGAPQYDFPVAKVNTSFEWHLGLLREYGIVVPKEQDFAKYRRALGKAVDELIEHEGLGGTYEAILLDEAQDYAPSEIRRFCRLADHIYCAADEKQKIYTGESSLETIGGLVTKTLRLRFHYRNGVKICRVADHIARKWPGYQPMAASSNYSEASNPSTVDARRCVSIQEQARYVLERLESQRLAFPGQLIGILCPTREALDGFGALLSQSQFADDVAIIHSKGAAAGFRSGKQIILSTFHAAKGLEFRAVHLVACEELARLSQTRRVAFMAVTRAKTALSIYYSGDLPGFLDAALHSLKPTVARPSLNDVFRGSR